MKEHGVITFAGELVVYRVDQATRVVSANRLGEESDLPMTKILADAIEDDIKRQEEKRKH